MLKALIGTSTLTGASLEGLDTSAQRGRVTAHRIANGTAASFDATLEGAADAAFAVLERGVRRFLGQDLLLAGVFPADPLFRAATTAGEPIAAAARRSPLLDAAAAALHALCPAGRTIEPGPPLTAYVQ
jgi:hypothetical protein